MNKLYSFISQVSFESEHNHILLLACRWFYEIIVSQTQTNESSLLSMSTSPCSQSSIRIVSPRIAYIISNIKRSSINDSPHYQVKSNNN